MESKTEAVENSVSETGDLSVRKSVYTQPSGFIQTGHFKVGVNPFASAPVDFKDPPLYYSTMTTNNPFSDKPVSSAVSSASDSDAEDKRPVLAPSHFGSQHSLPESSTVHVMSMNSRLLLKPSTLDKQTVHFKEKAASEVNNSTYKSSFRLEPPKLENPFSKKNNDAGEESPSKDVDFCPTGPVESKSCRKSDEAGGFVFGQNMEARVTAVDKAAKEDADKVQTNTGSESSSEYDKREKPVMNTVEVQTGEENESNVLKVFAKLHVFDTSTQTWMERGRGILRLNDMVEPQQEGFQSRLVMRSRGSLRVILNAKVWSGQNVERASPKSVRFTAYDAEEGHKIFLITANQKDCEQIFSAIDWRIQQLKSKESKEPKEIASFPCPRKRCREDTDVPGFKKQRLSQEQPGHAEESNDSSNFDPETEASNESFESTSPAVKSTSSDN